MQLKSDRDKVAHLLRRFGLGASEAELDYYGESGLKGAIDKLLDYDKVEEGFSLDINAMKPPNAQLVPMPAVQAHWITRMLVTRRPLQERMTLFWHDHFATSASKVSNPPLMYQQIETLRAGATGSFKELLTTVSQDPAMLFWLDNQFNVKGKPNENFAREVMELFTLGIGHYTEKDIQESARAFTGWSIARKPPRAANEDGSFRAASFQFRPNLHDATEKTIFGKTANFGGEDVLSMLCENPQTAKNIATKIWAWFAYPEPEAALVERLASRFLRSGLSIKALLRDVMESQEFYSAKAVRKVYKNPVDFVIVTMRQLGLGEVAANAIADSQGTTPIQRTRGIIGAAQQTLKSMGMELLFPPDVDGWTSGPGWISSATMVERIAWADRLFGQATAVARRAQVQGLSAWPLFEKDPRPQFAVDQLVSIFDAQLPASKIKQVVDAADKASGGRVTQENANSVASKVSRLIFGSPEFQFA